MTKLKEMQDFFNIYKAINVKETVTDFVFLGSKITAHSDCNHEIKRRLLLGRKVMVNIDRILKSRDIISPTKVRLVKEGYGFSCGHVWM